MLYYDFTCLGAVNNENDESENDHCYCTDPCEWGLDKKWLFEMA